MEIKGKITKMLELQEGVSASGKSWKKQLFLVQTQEQFNNLYCFEVFGESQVENLNKFNKVGDEVTVSFNVKTNESNGRYYTTLIAWNIVKDKEVVNSQGY